MRTENLDEPVRTIETARQNRQSNVITREMYWEVIRTKLRVLSELNEIAERENLTIRITPQDLELEIPLKEFKTSIKMFLNVEDIRSAPFSIIAEGPYEAFQANLLFKLGQQSKEFLDIGANMGYYTLGMPRINPDLKVHSFEPQPVTYKTLVRNLELNSLSGNVTTHNCGLGAENSVLTMFIPRFTGSGGGSFANLHVEEGEPEVFETPVYSLDKYLDSQSAPDLVKVDVEGFEFEVMLGGQETVSRNKPTIVIELLRKWMKPFGRHPQDVIDLLVPRGYLVYSIQENGLEAIRIIDDSTIETNFLFIHEENQKHFGVIDRFVRV